MDAANIDLKGFTEEFYRRYCAGHLEPVLETLEYVVGETDVWVEVTTLLIPGLNDSAQEIDALTRWLVGHLGPDVPLHFTAFHPDFKMMDRPPTPPETLRSARRIALGNGVRYCYTGNVHDPATQTTLCHECGAVLVGRDGYQLTGWALTEDGRCAECGTAVAGVFESGPGSWGSRRLPVRLGRHRQV